MTPTKLDEEEAIVEPFDCPTDIIKDECRTLQTAELNNTPETSTRFEKLEQEKT